MLFQHETCRTLARWKILTPMSWCIFTQECTSTSLLACVEVLSSSSPAPDPVPQSLRPPRSPSSIQRCDHSNSFRIRARPTRTGRVWNDRWCQIAKFSSHIKSPSVKWHLPNFAIWDGILFSFRKIHFPEFAEFIRIETKKLWCGGLKPQNNHSKDIISHIYHSDSLNSSSRYDAWYDKRHSTMMWLCFVPDWC
jgi:hypothetical protein